MNVAMKFDLEFFDDSSHALTTTHTGRYDTITLI
jgi:hypothetical protein